MGHPSSNVYKMYYVTANRDHPFCSISNHIGDEPKRGCEKVSTWVKLKQDDPLWIWAAPFYDFGFGTGWKEGGRRVPSGHTCPSCLQMQSDWQPQAPAAWGPHHAGLCPSIVNQNFSYALSFIYIWSYICCSIYVNSWTNDTLSTSRKLAIYLYIKICVVYKNNGVLFSWLKANVLRELITFMIF